MDPPLPGQITIPSVSSPNIDEHQWVINMKKSIEDERYKKCADTPVSVFVVPKDLMVVAPSSYTPQHVSLGPIHYWRPELHDMEVYKVAAARRLQINLRDQDFDSLVNKITKLEPQIRSSYQRFIRYDSKILAWIIAIDAAFLLEFLQLYNQDQENKVPSAAPSTVSQVHDDNAESTTEAVTHGEIDNEEEDTVLTRSHLVHSHVHNYAGTKHALNAIIRDIMMLENQIPLFVLRETLKAQFLSSNKDIAQSSAEEFANKELYSMMKGFFKEVCPFNFITDDDSAPFDSTAKIQFSKRTHLLDCLYHMILPKAEKLSSNDETDHEPYDETGKSGNQSEGIKEVPHLKNTGQIIECLSKVRTLLSQIDNLPKPLLSLLKAISVLVKLPWSFFSQEEKEASNSGAQDNLHLPPEITIPSATELSRAGVRFSAITEGEFTTISFDTKKARFSLPAISLDENTEVVLRNLVAYESSLFTSEPLYFTRYTELMNGIIDNEDDGKLLRAKRVILHQSLKGDEEAAKLWNNMSRSIRPTKVPGLDEVIPYVNRYYNRRWMIKIERYLRLYVYESWQVLAFLAAVLMLLFQMFDAFCSVYNCRTQFHFKYSANQ